MKNPVFLGLGALGAVALIAGLVFMLGRGRPKPPNIALNTEEETLLRLTNEARASGGLSTLKLDADLVSVARTHSHYMKLRKELCLPTGGLDRQLKQVGYDFDSWGLVIDLIHSISIEQAFEKALKTPDTARQILEPKFEDVGVGVADVKEMPGMYFLTIVLASKKK